MAVELLPVSRAAELGGSPPEHRWLVEALWSDSAVGVIGGEPKSCKSFLALDLAVAVASGAPCLRRFDVEATGPVLLFAAEDSLDVVRTRLFGIAQAAGTSFDALDVHVITADVVRLDVEQDRKRLRSTVEAIRPRLLVLDPFVRLHRCDENSASEVVPMLAYLRELQRAASTAVLLVHHARKTAHARAGQALRGSSEIHAWGDSYLYLRRSKDRLVLSVEHRAAPAIDEIFLELCQDGPALALKVSRDRDQEDQPLDEWIVKLLKDAPHPVTQRKLREACSVRTASIASALQKLVHDKIVVRDPSGYRLL